MAKKNKKDTVDTTHGKIRFETIGDEMANSIKNNKTVVVEDKV